MEGCVAEKVFMRDVAGDLVVGSRIGPFGGISNLPTLLLITSPRYLPVSRCSYYRTQPPFRAHMHSTAIPTANTILTQLVYGCIRSE